VQIRTYIDRLKKLIRGGGGKRLKERARERAKPEIIVEWRVLARNLISWNVITASTE